MTLRSLGRHGRLTLLFATAFVAVGITAGSASAATITFSNTAGIGIPDNKNGDPFPSTINVAGANNVQKVTATLKGWVHSCSSDVAVLLVGPTGANTILMGQDDGGCDSGLDPVNVTFDQSATDPVPDPLTSGTFQPTSTTDPDPFNPPAPPGPTYPVDLNVFNGASGTGAWKLFVADQVSGDTGAIFGGWSLTMTAPFNTATLGTPTINKKKGTGRVPVTVVDSGQLTLSGKGVKSAASKSAAVGPGTVNLTVKPKGKTAKKLNDTGKATVKVTITFTPNGGSPNSQSLKLKLKKTH